MGIRPKKEKQKPRSRECAFCKSKTVPVWSNTEVLSEYLSARSRILTSSFTGVCVKHQKAMALAIKRARHLALLPFTSQE